MSGFLWIPSNHCPTWEGVNSLQQKRNWKIQNHITKSNLPEILLRIGFQVYLNKICQNSERGSAIEGAEKLQKLFACIRALPLVHTQNHVSGLSYSDSTEFGLAPEVINLSFHGKYSLLVWQSRILGESLICKVVFLTTAMAGFLIYYAQTRLKTVF